MNDPARVSRAANNFNVQGLFGHTTSQIPAFEGPYGGTLANLGSNYTFTNGYFGSTKQVPAFYDNFTKIVSTHTLKAGFYWDDSQNKQTSDNPDFGIYNFGANTFSTNNYVADLELGRVLSYQQQNYAPVQNIKWHQWSIYGQDSWKAAKTLTVNIGVRFDHIGQWYGTDFQVWDPATYVNSASAPNNTGVAWHAIDPSIPASGFPSKTLQTSPRLGLAYDIFGNGRTVFRGGIGIYYYQASTEVFNGALGPLDSFAYTTPTAFEGYANIASFTPPSSVAQNGSNIYAMQMGDSRISSTTNWNATVSQALPRRTVLEVSYIGNRSANEYMDGTNSNLYNLNNVLPGGFFQPDPKTGVYSSPNAPSCPGGGATDWSLYCQNNPAVYAPTFNANDYRPLLAYQNVFLLTHASYSKYNSAQVSVQKQSGPATFVANYTFSKVLGIRDGVSNNGNGNGTAVDPFNLNANYGPLAYDHTHIVNLTYNWQLPSFLHGKDAAMKVAGGAVNGWKISGYTAYQSGAPIQPNIGGNFNTMYPTGLTVPTVQHPNLPDNSITMPDGVHANAITPSTWLGSSAYNVIVPALSCNPLTGLRSVHTADGTQKMRFNPACFTMPAQGTQGPDILPYMRYPNYWDSDLGIYKSFHITESQRIEIRASATNFLNHPLGVFGLANNSDQQINFQQTTNATCTGCVTSAGTPISVVSLATSNTNATTTGAPTFKTGSRFVTLALKYYF